ncbi:S-adenosylmethionine-dependent methyltransferase Rv2258c-like isoform X2 [Physella acuta]|uniref:S-adenosylmethionine-dependent methyltransferase Rv2258c-like isoform X2 n=1 Tax=Physella acuta TaxID=109671 RepID=UPI0027DCB7E9|nr:S-adenosylmethionine-dependent methyltransferase Rv2258c-like isoform X2 [Physella acuta]
MSSFQQKLGSLLNGTAVAFALSIAKDTGILEALIDATQPLTSQEIANEKRLKERYVRDVLASLGTVELLQMTSDESGNIRYHLAEQDKLTLKSSMMAFISFTKIFASVYEPVKSCFPLEGPYGVRYSSFVHDVIDEFSMYSVDGFVDGFLKHTQGLKDQLEQGIDVIEFGSGRGRLIAKLAAMFPQSSFTTSDVSTELLDKQRARWGHLPNIHYQVNDLCCLPDVIPKQYDWIFCADVIHDLPDPLGALKGIRRLVKPGGVFTFIDIATSGSPLADRGSLEVACYYAAGTFLCIPESFQQESSQALGPCWGKAKAVELVGAADFRLELFTLEGLQALCVCRP